MPWPLPRLEKFIEKKVSKKLFWIIVLILLSPPKNRGLYVIGSVVLSPLVLTALVLRFALVMPPHQS